VAADLENRWMWLFVLFDVPVDTKENRRAYVRFRNELLRRGFSMLHFSVYARCCPNEEATKTLRSQLRPCIPPDARVRFLGVTDRQFERMECFIGKTVHKPEERDSQLLLF
jgi:CRISPR-associated protein Cas2